VFRETASGADRAELRKVLAKLDEDDVLMVTGLDWLPRLRGCKPEPQKIPPTAKGFRAQSRDDLKTQ
jgi:hypothetical protein